MENIINVQNIEGQMVVSSREVAQNFEKEHKNVLQTIKNLVAENQAAKNFFIESSYENRGKQYPEYLCTRDGFTLLAMGFTGQKALGWKLKYIDAFNKMEKTLKNNIAGFIVPQNLPEALRLAADLYERNEDLKLLNETKSKQIAELEPKARYTDIILQSKALVATTQIAKDYGMSGREFNDLLHDMRIQYKVNKQWVLYSDYDSFGYTHSETIHFTHTDGHPDTRMHTKWTQKGRLFLYEKLKNRGILPSIECKMCEVM